MGKKKYIITLSTIIIVLLIIVFCGHLLLKDLFQQTVVFSNKSEQTIESVEIKYCDEKILLQNVESKSTISKDIESHQDCGFDIKISFSNGSIIQEEDLGYITNGDGSDHVFVITKGNILELNNERIN